MKYLQYIELLNQLMRILKNSQRTLITISSAKTCLAILMKMTDLPQAPSIQTLYNDLIAAFVSVCKREDLEYLTESSRQQLLCGIMSLKDMLIVEAYEYYSEHDMPELNVTLISLFREIYECALRKGVAV